MSNGYNVAGKSISDILNMPSHEFISLNARDLARATTRLVSAANKRLRRMQAAGITSTAYNRAMESGGFFSVKDKSFAQIRSEFSRVRQFLNSKTSTLKGIKQIEKETIKSLEKSGIKIDKSKINEVFKIYGELEKIDESVKIREYKYKVLNAITSMPDNIDIDEKINQMQSRLREIYEQQTDLEGRNKDVSGFFI